MMAKYMLKRNHCIYCSEDHKSDSCNAFLNQTLKERIHFLARTKIYYGSLQSMEDEHNPKSCNKRLSCITCKKKHPTSLHAYIPENKKVTGDWDHSQNDQEEVSDDVTFVSILGKAESKGISMGIVPVSMNYGKNGKQITYAMLDNCSQCSFVQGTVKQLWV